MVKFETFFSLRKHRPHYFHNIYLKFRRIRSIEQEIENSEHHQFNFNHVVQQKM